MYTLRPIERLRPSAVSATPILELVQVGKTFGAGERFVRAIEDVSFAVHPGEFVSVIGPSGCGKSTLFELIGGLINADQGTVRVGGAPVNGPHPNIGMVFQDDSTFPWRTVLGNVSFGLEAAGVPKAERIERARRFIRMVGLEAFEQHYPAELSGGMRQRTALARTLATEPQILLMDEPFAALDEQTRILLGDELQLIARSLQQTVLLITHNITEAVLLSDRVIVMTFRPGRVKTEVEVDLSHPRSSDQVASERFGKLVGEVWEALQEEARRGLLASRT